MPGRMAKTKEIQSAKLNNAIQLGCHLIILPNNKSTSKRRNVAAGRASSQGVEPLPRQVPAVQKPTICPPSH
jgi:hypothetical protein